MRGSALQIDPRPVVDPAFLARPEAPQAISVPTAIAVAAGVGLAAIAGGLFYALSGGKPKKRKKRVGSKADQA